LNSQPSFGSVLVIGGGVGGIQAALDLAESGYKVHLLEASPTIGGLMATLDKTFPTNDCSLCILSPKLVDCGRHHNIELLTYTEVCKVSGEAGNFTVQLRKKPRYVDATKCTGCGLCAQYCPVNAIDSFNQGLSDRSAIYIDYPQAVPLTFLIDRDQCIGCGLCDNICLAHAINYSDTEQSSSLNVGAIILAPGAESIDAKAVGNYGYQTFPNVVTSQEFERILSASGPFHGRVQRPSDGAIPHKIAFLQCIGSRDRSCEREYCSSVCCMYSIKEAIIAKEHATQIQPTIFFIDIRAHGKNFDKYVDRAKDEYGIQFTRCRIASIQEHSHTKDLILRYQTKEGAVTEEVFQLVVLATGFQPSTQLHDLAQTIGVNLDDYGFCQTSEILPLETSRPGVYVCGMFESPKDIPETVTQASAAAAAAGGLLAPVRGTLVSRRSFPHEIDVQGIPPRVGVFVCHCGINIGGVVTVPDVVTYAKTLPNVVYADENLYTCSSDTQEQIKEKIREHQLNRVVVASCTPRTHEALFQETIREAGLNRYLFEMANIRDQCSWVHMHEHAAATQKARDLVRIAVTKARLLQPIKTLPLSINHNGLIIGGGIAGLNAALALADQGYETYLLEKEHELGGFARTLRYTLEGTNTRTYLASLIEKVQHHERIQALTGVTITDILGYVGNFITRFTDIEGVNRSLEHGVTIVATGGEEYQPHDYLFQDDPRVITQSDLEQRLEDAKNFTANNVVMIQCVGSRSPEHPYCSRVCCGDAIKNALRLKERSPDVNVYVLYRDIRTYGLAEPYYQLARAAGVLFIRYDETCPPKVTRHDDDTCLNVVVHDTNLDASIMLQPDLLVLSTAIIPAHDNESLSKMLKVPLNEDGWFLEAHAKLRPVDFATEGVFLCGLAHGPKTIKESIAQAYAAVSRACTILSKETIEAVGIVAAVNEDRCIACANCEIVCEYNAIQVTKAYAEVNPLLCKGCGTCAVECPAMAITMQHFTDDQVSAMITAALEPISHLKEPKALALFCNWCAYAGADLAGVSRFQYPTNVRIVRVMCTGRIDEKYILQALLQGADGVLIGGCHIGDCHYTSGNLQAEERVQRVHQWLKEAGIDPTRLRLEWISAGEGKRLADVMTDFTQQLKKLGPSPLRPLSNATR
jgi:heterodisulfide reductase subunit A